MASFNVQPARTEQVCPVPTHACISAVERLYPRICTGLVQLWFRAGIDTYLNSLILDDRMDRQGFPVEVFDELLFLSELRWAMSHAQRVAEAGHRDGDDYTFETGYPVVSHSRTYLAADRSM